MLRTCCAITVSVGAFTFRLPGRGVSGGETDDSFSASFRLSNPPSLGALVMLLLSRARSNTAAVSLKFDMEEATLPRLGKRESPGPGLLIDPLPGIAPPVCRA